MKRLILIFRLESYDWRAAESRFNSTLPQFRTTITTVSRVNPEVTQSLRVHFVHKRSKHPNAVPLLLSHTWPSSFIEVQRIIDTLTEPRHVPGHGGATPPQAFHVVAPSIPGFGFSDASMEEGFGLDGTSEVFQKLMERLGYKEFVAHGTGW
jgi:pimeloyl-ACP methyl ester carboxylesterase